MIEFALGAVAAAALYTFWPSLATIPSGWLRTALAWARGGWMTDMAILTKIHYWLAFVAPGHCAGWQSGGLADGEV